MATTKGAAMAGYEAIHLSEIPDPEGEKKPGERDWRPIRIHFGIQSFGTSAYVAHEAGDVIVSEHNEVDTRHEELFVVSSGHATFTIGGDEVDAPAGTLVYVPDPEAMRGAVAQEASTTILCFGGTPGEAFSVSQWEKEYDPAHAD